MSSNGTIPTYKTCTEVSPQCPVSATTYGYTPNTGGNVFLAIFFGCIVIASLFLGVKKRTWTYTLGLSVGALLETLGYIGRVLMSQNPWNSGGFQLQIICLILAPSFVAAAIYLTLKNLVLYFGEEYSLLKAKLYPLIFVGCDIGSIVLQAIGGGVAAAAGNSNNADMLNTGNYLMIAGIAFQVATMALCGLLSLVYLYRYRNTKQESTGEAIEMARGGKYSQIKDDAPQMKKLLLYCGAVALSYLVVLIRCIYRYGYAVLYCTEVYANTTKYSIPEMAGGWGNPLMQNETEFLILDGA